MTRTLTTAMMTMPRMGPRQSADWGPNGRGRALACEMRQCARPHGRPPPPHTARRTTASGFGSEVCGSVALEDRLAMPEAVTKKRLDGSLRGLGWPRDGGGGGALCFPSGRCRSTAYSHIIARIRIRFSVRVSVRVHHWGGSIPYRYPLPPSKPAAPKSPPPQPPSPREFCLTGQHLLQGWGWGV